MKLKLSVAEQKFQPLVDDWLEEFRNSLWSEEGMDNKYFTKLCDYETCFVGDVRDKLGLHRDYRHDCYDCKDVAQRLADIIIDQSNDIAKSNSRKYKIKYLRLLRRLEKHLTEKHSVKLPNVK